MGSPISGAIAESMLQNWKVLKRKLTVRNARKIKQIGHHRLRSCKPFSKCTMLSLSKYAVHRGGKKTGVLPFWDVLCCRNTNSNLTQHMFMKTNTDPIPLFDRYRPVMHNLSCIDAWFNRIDAHSSIPRDYERVKQTALRHFPKTVTHRT